MMQINQEDSFKSLRTWKAIGLLTLKGFLLYFRKWLLSGVLHSVRRFVYKNNEKNVYVDNDHFSLRTNSLYSC